jgi:hypothetical protein
MSRRVTWLRLDQMVPGVGTTWNPVADVVITIPRVKAVIVSATIAKTSPRGAADRLGASAAVAASGVSPESAASVSASGRGSPRASRRPGQGPDPPKRHPGRPGKLRRNLASRALAQVHRAHVIAARAAVSFQCAGTYPPALPRARRPRTRAVPQGESPFPRRTISDCGIPSHTMSWHKRTVSSCGGRYVRDEGLVQRAGIDTRRDQSALEYWAGRCGRLAIALLFVRGGEPC